MIQCYIGYITLHLMVMPMYAQSQVVESWSSFLIPYKICALMYLIIYQYIIVMINEPIHPIFLWETSVKRAATKSN